MLKLIAKSWLSAIPDYFNIDKLVSDTGTTWRFDKTVFQFAKILISPYQYYLPAYNAFIFTFSNQRIHFHKQSLYGGVYNASDSIAWLLNIPRAGKFTVKESIDPVHVLLQLDEGVTSTWISFKRWGMTAGLLPYNFIDGWKNYQINDTDYHVEFVLGPLHTP